MRLMVANMLRRRRTNDDDGNDDRQYDEQSRAGKRHMIPIHTRGEWVYDGHALSRD